MQTGTQPLDFTCQPPNTGDVTSENGLHDRITEAYPIGGGAGVKQLCAQGTTGVAAIQYARQTSAPDATVCTGLNYVAYGRDGITWETFPNVAGSATAGVNNLTTAQLQGIYVNCTITNWNQVGGANAPIILYTILPQYGTRKAFDGFLGGSSSSLRRHQADRSDRQQRDPGRRPGDRDRAGVDRLLERALLGQTGGRTAAARLDRRRRARPRRNIPNGSFMFSRFLYNVYCAGDPASATSAAPPRPATARHGQVRAARPAGSARPPAHVRRSDHRHQLPHRDRHTRSRDFGFAPLPLGPHRRRDHHSPTTAGCRQEPDRSAVTDPTAGKPARCSAAAPGDRHDRHPAPDPPRAHASRPRVPADGQRRPAS